MITTHSRLPLRPNTLGRGGWACYVNNKLITVSVTLEAISAKHISMTASSLRRTGFKWLVEDTDDYGHTLGENHQKISCAEWMILCWYNLNYQMGLRIAGVESTGHLHDSMYNEYDKHMELSFCIIFEGDWTCPSLLSGGIYAPSVRAISGICGRSRGLPTTERWPFIVLLHSNYPSLPRLMFRRVSSHWPCTTSLMMSILCLITGQSEGVAGGQSVVTLPIPTGQYDHWFHLLPLFCFDFRGSDSHLTKQKCHIGIL